MIENFNLGGLVMSNALTIHGFQRNVQEKIVSLMKLATVLILFNIVIFVCGLFTNISEIIKKILQIMHSYGEKRQIDVCRSIVSTSDHVANVTILSI